METSTQNINYSEAEAATQAEKRKRGEAENVSRKKSKVSSGQSQTKKPEKTKEGQAPKPPPPQLPTSNGPQPAALATTGLRGERLGAEGPLTPSTEGFKLFTDAENSLFDNKDPCFEKLKKVLYNGMFFLFFLFFFKKRIEDGTLRENTMVRKQDIPNVNIDSVRYHWSVYAKWDSNVMMDVYQSNDAIFKFFADFLLCESYINS
jgi:hypothetical protein